MNALSKAIVETLGIKGLTAASIKVGSYADRPTLVIEMDYSLIQDEVNRRMEEIKRAESVEVLYETPGVVICRMTAQERADAIKAIKDALPKQTDTQSAKPSA